MNFATFKKNQEYISQTGPVSLGGGHSNSVGSRITIDCQNDKQCKEILELLQTKYNLINK